MPLRKIRLYGKLGKLFGKEWNLDVSSVGEALRAINVNTNGKFENYFRTEGAFKHFKISVKRKNNTILKEEINTPYEEGDIFITPVIKGSGKNSGLIQTIIGVVLIVIGFITEYHGLTKMGIALVLGGVVQMLSPNPKLESVERRSSFLFQGNTTAVSQNSPVGLIYGRSVVTPMPICISMDNIDENNYQGEVFYTGPIGPVTQLLYSYRGGTAYLIGQSEFTTPATYCVDSSTILYPEVNASAPPKKYRTITWDGSISISEGSCLVYGSVYGEKIWNKLTEEISNSSGRTGNGGTYSNNSIFNFPEDAIFIPSYCLDYPEYFALNSTVFSTTSIKQWIGNIYDLYNCITNIRGGQLSVTLSDEDTESDAINRLLSTVSWSAWQTTQVYPFYYRNITNFNISYQEVRIKTDTSEKFNPGLSYKYSYTIQRRAYGSSDPWVDAETITGVKKPNSNGDLEFNIENISGYESQITNLNINF